MANEKKNEDDLGFECSSIAEEMLYADVLREFEQGKIIENLWEKSLVLSKDSSRSSNDIYFELRVKSLESELENDRKKLKEQENKNIVNVNESEENVYIEALKKLEETSGKIKKVKAEKNMTSTKIIFSASIFLLLVLAISIISLY